MNSVTRPAPIRKKEVALAFLAAALLLLAIAGVLMWLDALRPTPPPIEEDFVTEFLVEDPEESDETERADTPDQPEQVAQAEPHDASVDAEQTSPDTADAQPPEEEEEEVPPIEVVALPPDAMRRQSVDQPTTNAEEPETDDYFLSEVDNRADQQTIAENATTEYEDTAPVDQRAQDSESTEAPATPTPSRDQENESSQEPSESESEKDRREDEQPAKGDPNAEARELRELEARRRETRDQEAQTMGDELRETSTSPFEQATDGRVQVYPEAQTAEEYGRASGLGAQMQQAAQRAEQDGRGRDSLTRSGARHADQHFDELFGERTAEYRERSEETARRESMLGDQRGDWQRTREAMENYDVAVTTGTETMLNTRRDDHARFINAFHAKIHDPWWKVLELLDRRYSPSESVSNRSLTVRLEVRVLADGKVDRVRIVETSGNTFFDAEAVRVNYSVRTTAAPQAKILCDDGSVYLHWTYSRAPGRCGTHGASVHCPQ